MQLRINSKESIRKDGLYFNLTDLFKLTKKDLNPWRWAQSVGITRHISRRGWIFRSCWAKQDVLLRYAEYLGIDVKDSLGLVKLEGRGSVVTTRNFHRSASPSRSAYPDPTPAVIFSSSTDDWSSYSSHSPSSHSSYDSGSYDSGSCDSGSYSSCD